MHTSSPKKRKKGCLYCGNNPTNHTMCYISQSLLTLGLPFDEWTAFLMRPIFFDALHDYFTVPWMWMLSKTYLIRFQPDSDKACSDRSKVIWKEAEARGIIMEQMVVADKPVEQYRAFLNGKWNYFTSLPIPPKRDRVSYGWMDSKLKLKQHLQKHGIAVGQGGAAHNKREALVIFNSVRKPVIVKPEHGSRGRHSLTNLNTEADFLHAFTIAQQLCRSVVVEEHLVGSVYRATYVDGAIAGILRGDPPRVTGNGSDTIASLIAKKNEHRPEHVGEIIISKVITEFLEKQGYTLDTILEAGKTIDVIEKVGLSYGGNSSEDTPITHPKLIAQLKAAGDSLNTPLVGFDFISEDITKDPDTVRWGIIEANSMPFIDLHHFPREGTPINVAAKVWDMWKR